MRRVSTWCPPAPVVVLAVFAAALVGAYTATAVAAGPQLRVAPVPTPANPNPGTPVVTWATGNGSPGAVTVSHGTGPETLFASGADGSQPAPWLVAGQRYVFRLTSGAGDAKRLLVVLRVGRAAPAVERVALPKAPRRTPAWVDRVLQVLPYVVVAALAALALAVVRERRS